MPDGTSVTKYFEILPAFLSFTQSEKDAFWVEANLDNNKTVVDSFMNYANDKIDELFIQQQVQSNVFCFKDVTNKGSWITTVIRVLILCMNFILFFALEINDGKKLENPRIFGATINTTKLIMYILGATILGLFTYLAAIQGIIVLKLQAKRALKEESEEGNLKKALKLSWYIVTNLEETLQARSIWCLLLCFGFSIAGIAFDFFWFAFTLIYMIIFSPQVMEVVNAIWGPKKRIISTLMLSFIVLYWFAIIAYVYFGNDFNSIIEGSNTTLRRCLAVIFDSWYKFGLGAFLAENGKSAILDETEDGNKYDLRTNRMTFDFMFFFIVPTLLLSILSGIIIDNFGERRSHSDSISQRQNDQCFICGKPSSELPNFKQHCKFTHNIWDYMYYIGYLKEMRASERIDYTDMHVHHCLTTNSNAWFPSYTPPTPLSKLQTWPNQQYLSDNS